MEERIKQGNMRIIYSPVRKREIYMSKILVTFLFAGSCHIIVIALLHFILGVNFGGWNSVWVVALMLLFEFFASSLGVMLCCIFKSENTANQILSIFINISAILGGLFFQLDGMGSAIAKLSFISPVKWIVNAIFRIIYDGDFSWFIPCALILIALSLISSQLCSRFFRTEDYI
jgi:ABC-2 type transport system permease protein